MEPKTKKVKFLSKSIDEIGLKELKDKSERSRGDEKYRKLNSDYVDNKSGILNRRKEDSQVVSSTKQEEITKEQVSLKPKTTNNFCLLKKAFDRKPKNVTDVNKPTDKLCMSQIHNKTENIKRKQIEDRINKRAEFVVKLMENNHKFADKSKDRLIESYTKEKFYLYKDGNFEDHVKERAMQRAASIENIVNKKLSKRTDQKKKGVNDYFIRYVDNSTSLTGTINRENSQRLKNKEILDIWEEQHNKRMLYEQNRKSVEKQKEVEERIEIEHQIEQELKQLKEKRFKQKHLLAEYNQKAIESKKDEKESQKLASSRENLKIRDQLEKEIRDLKLSETKDKKIKQANLNESLKVQVAVKKHNQAQLKRVSSQPEIPSFYNGYIEHANVSPKKQKDV